MDIYKQFFYQEQMLRIYEQAGQKDVCVYNFLILPDHMKDTGNSFWRLCAEITFPYHEEQSIAVLQIDMDALIDVCVSDNRDLIEKRTGSWLRCLQNLKE